MDLWRAEAVTRKGRCDMEQEVMRPRIGTQEVVRAAEILRQYRRGKENLDKRIIDNEQFWKMRHWEQMEKAGRGGNPHDPRPASGWLVNCILSKHADAMDSYPEPTVLPREPDDREEAEKLTRILPVILQNNRFKKEYARAWWNKLKSGCAVYGVFWDGGKLHGLGDIDIRSMDVLNLFWEPGVQDIQASENFFSVELTPNHRLLRDYPQLEGKLGRGGASQVSRYLYDDRVDTSDQSLVVDWYYHTVTEGRQVLHYCKFVGETVLYASENDPQYEKRGWYDHGQYPFVFDVLFPEEGTPCGYGYVDLCKPAQKQIDLMNQAILKNTLAAATPRFFIRSDGAVNEEEYADWTQPFVHTNGNLGADSIAPIRVPTLDSVYVAVLQNKVAEMKETVGNRDVMSGGTAGGVTAATAIAALQEAGGRPSDCRRSFPPCHGYRGPAGGGWQAVPQYDRRRVPGIRAGDDAVHRAGAAVLQRTPAVPAAGPRGGAGVPHVRQRRYAAQGSGAGRLSGTGVRSGDRGAGRDTLQDHGVQPAGAAAVPDGVFPRRYGRAGPAVSGADGVQEQGPAGIGHPAGTAADPAGGVAPAAAADGGAAAGRQTGDKSCAGAGAGDERRRGARRGRGEGGQRAGRHGAAEKAVP